MSLKARLAMEIARSGPIRIDAFMTRCLHDPAFGYYATRPALGEGGDFITAPLVSQMFGEMLGAWACEVWARLGRPSRLCLVELGPGDGTLMSDVLRVAGKEAGFRSSCEPWMVETSAPLRAAQARAAPGARFADGVRDLPHAAPVVILANEFLDCLPIRQAVWRAGEMRERRVGLGGDGGLAFIEAEVAVEGPARGEGPAEDASMVVEHSPALTQLAAEVGGLIARAGGAALFIDYGRDGPGLGDTLQALRRHRKEDPLQNPGCADLTAHVDFPAFLSAARQAGAETSRIERQGDFLRRLGIEARAEALTRASPAQAGKIARQLRRLVGADQMGELFKVACIHSPGLSPP